MTDVNQNKVQRSHVQQTIAANNGCRLEQHGHNLTSIDEYS